MIPRHQTSWDTAQHVTGWEWGVNSTAPVSINGGHTSANLHIILLNSIFKNHPLCVPDSLGIHHPWKVSLRRVSENNYHNFAKMWDKTLLFLQSATEAETIAEQYTRDWEVASWLQHLLNKYEDYSLIPQKPHRSWVWLCTPVILVYRQPRVSNNVEGAGTDTEGCPLTSSRVLVHARLHAHHKHAHTHTHRNVAVSNLLV